jgi:protein phosphatase
MADFVLRVGSRSSQGIRPSNEDRLHVDVQKRIFLIADGMGGQERGDVASGMAVDIIPRVVHDCLCDRKSAEQALQDSFQQANEAIVDAGKNQPFGRRMGTTAVCALHQDGRVYIAGLGDSRAYLIRGERVDQLTMDHSVAQALVLTGALSAEEARSSPYAHVLHKFLGCANLSDGAEVKPFTPEAGDRLLLASDGLTNHIGEDDLRDGAKQFGDPQDWANHLVTVALERGSRDNVTCIVVVFQPS